SKAEKKENSRFRSNFQPSFPLCSKKAHPLNVLTVTYPGGRTRQFSLRAELVPQVRHWLENYKNLKKALEEICELNHHLLRREEAPDHSQGQGRKTQRVCQAHQAGGSGEPDRDRLRWRSGAHPCHEEDHQNCRRSGL